jgi:hypothetical protein
MRRFSHLSYAAGIAGLPKPWIWPREVLREVCNLLVLVVLLFYGMRVGAPLVP